MLHTFNLSFEFCFDQTFRRSSKYSIRYLCFPNLYYYHFLLFGGCERGWIITLVFQICEDPRRRSRHVFSFTPCPRYLFRFRAFLIFCCENNFASSIAPPWHFVVFPVIAFLLLLSLISLLKRISSLLIEEWLESKGSCEISEDIQWGETVHTQ